jgi:putative transposase
VRKVTGEAGLLVIRCPKRHFVSYQGELKPAPANLIERDFHADQPN